MKNASLEVDLCSEAVSEIYLLAADVVFDVKKKAQGMYMMADGVGIYYCSFLIPPMPRTQSDAKASTTLHNFNFTQNQVLSHILPAFLKKTGASIDSMAHTQAVEVGEQIGEPALWVKSWRHQGQFQALTDNSRVLLVSTEDLFSLLQEYSEEMVSAIVYARVFVQELNSTMSQATDLPMASQPA